MARVWTLVSISEGRQYGGNLGYADDPTAVYRYDSSVPNHLQLAAGDLVFIRNRKQVLGMARIGEIAVGSGSKTRLKCPTCGTPHIRERHGKTPPWRCVEGHEFEAPNGEEAEVTTYEARFHGQYVPLNGSVTVTELKRCAMRPSDQLSIEEVTVRAIANQIALSGTAVRDLLERFLQGNHPDPSGYDLPSPGADNEYAPSLVDARERINRSIALRRGQRRFRSRLIERYGPHCMISKCGLLEIIEAAHIWPYRGDDDNHPANGLLLRTDLHTLFDLDLLGIDPSTLTVKLHPGLVPAGYAQFAGVPLHKAKNRSPAVEALSRRWASFQERLQQT